MPLSWYSYVRIPALGYLLSLRLQNRKSLSVSSVKFCMSCLSLKCSLENDFTLLILCFLVIKLL
uniref:Uncharacterized protein n=1 Tax=Anguilla anguilla TaxID=7936 RepID=A0A0E9R170_ANGAN